MVKCLSRCAFSIGIQFSCTIGDGPVGYYGFPTGVPHLSNSNRSSIYLYLLCWTFMALAVSEGIPGAMAELVFNG